MLLNSKEIIELSKISPVLVVGAKTEDFKNSTVLKANIPSKSLGVVNTATGIKTPLWLFQILKSDASHQIVIEEIDSIDAYSQEKFYELLKYKTISNIDLPEDCNIIVTAKKLENVSANIACLCQIVK